MKAPFEHYSPASPKYLRPLAIVATYGVSERTVRRWIADGSVESVRIGRNVFVTTASIERLFSTGAR